MRALGLITPLALLALTSCGTSAHLTCSPAAARAAVAKTRPSVDVGERMTVTPDAVDRVLCFGDERTGMAVTVASGGTAGDVAWLFFAPNGRRWRLASSGAGYKLSLRRSGSGFELVQPVYEKSDPNCCPTGGFDRTLYRWNGTRLAVARAWHTKTFR